MKLKLNSSVASVAWPQGLNGVFESLPSWSIGDLMDRDVELDRAEGTFVGKRLAHIDGIGKNGRERIRKKLISLGFSDINRLPGRLQRRFKAKLAQLPKRVKPRTDCED